MLVWSSTVNTSGTWLRTTIDLPLDALAKASGLNPLDRNNYMDAEEGYDGWELHGTFDGEPFNLYTRWGVLRVGGNDRLNVDGLIAALRAAIT